MATYRDSDRNRLSREEHRKAKELEELRKTGAAAPEIDEEGNMINPHIPRYVSQTPWYYESSGPSLKHQTSKYFSDRQKQYSGIHDKSTVRDVDDSAVGTKWRKGSCENCGSMSHTKKDCLQRPRSSTRTAKYVNTTLERDVKLSESQMSFDGKRDRWEGFDVSRYSEVVERHNRIEAERAARRAQEVEETLRRKEKQLEERKAREETGKNDTEMAKGTKMGDLLVESDDESDTETKEDDDKLGLLDPGKLQQKPDQISRPVQNLRIREEIPKYLLNLDVNSAYYDPKTRSMRENPLEGKTTAGDATFQGDNVLRMGGDVKEVAQLQRFVWDANDYGNDDLNIVANPTEVVTKRAEYLKRLEAAKAQEKQALEAAYGSAAIPKNGQDKVVKQSSASESYGQMRVKTLPKELLDGQSEHFIEYTPDGRVLKAPSIAIPSSRYEEDKYENGHTQIWGSYYSIEEARWGYGCCHSLSRNAYCTGDAGRKASIMSAIKTSTTDVSPSASVGATTIDKSIHLDSKSLPTSKDVQPDFVEAQKVLRKSEDKDKEDFEESRRKRYLSSNPRQLSAKSDKKEVRSRQEVDSHSRTRDHSDSRSRSRSRSTSSDSSHSASSSFSRSRSRSRSRSLSKERVHSRSHSSSERSSNRQ